MDAKRFIHWDNPLFEIKAKTYLGSSFTTCDDIIITLWKMNGEMVLHKEQPPRKLEVVGTKQLVELGMTQEFFKTK